MICYVHCFDAGTPEVISLYFNLTSELNSTTPTFTLTCTSTGGPATFVTWMRNDEMLAENSNYNITSQILIYSENATYNHTLTVTGRLGGEYECNVSNGKASSSSGNITVVGEYYIGM